MLILTKVIDKDTYQLVYTVECENFIPINIGDKFHYQRSDGSSIRSYKGVAVGREFISADTAMFQTCIVYVEKDENSKS